MARIQTHLIVFCLVAITIAITSVITISFGGWDLFYSKSLKILKDGDEVRKGIPGKNDSRDTPSKVDSTISYPSEIELVKVPAGEFMMGSAVSEKGHQERESPRHRVRIKEFYLSRYEVTNEVYNRFLQANPEVDEPAFWDDKKSNHPKQPVVGVSWYDAKKFCEWAGLRLPSEAEWEYACRAGTQTPFYDGFTLNDLNRAGWFRTNSKDKTHFVGEKEPNAFGLYDMLGNVLEWTSSRWGGNAVEEPAFKYPYDSNDGREDQTVDDFRILRGGSYERPWQLSRCAWRCRYAPDSRDRYYGFRTAWSQP